MVGGSVGKWRVVGGSVVGSFNKTHPCVLQLAFSRAVSSCNSTAYEVLNFAWLEYCPNIYLTAIRSFLKLLLEQ